MLTYLQQSSQIPLCPVVANVAVQDHPLVCRGDAVAVRDRQFVPYLSFFAVFFILCRLKTVVRSFLQLRLIPLQLIVNLSSKTKQCNRILLTFPDQSLCDVFVSSLRPRYHCHDKFPKRCIANPCPPVFLLESRPEEVSQLAGYIV